MFSSGHSTTDMVMISGHISDHYFLWTTIKYFFWVFHIKLLFIVNWVTALPLFIICEYTLHFCTKASSMNDRGHSSHLAQMHTHHPHCEFQTKRSEPGFEPGFDTKKIPTYIRTVKNIRQQEIKQCPKFVKIVL